MSMLHQMAAGKRVAPKRKPRRFIAEWPIEIHRQIGEGSVTDKTGFDIMGTDIAHKRWRGGRQQGDVIDLLNESDVEYITGIALVERIPGLPFGDSIGEAIGGDPDSDETTRTIGAPARQGWYVYDKTEGIRYKIDKVDRLPDGRALFLTTRMQS